MLAPFWAGRRPVVGQTVLRVKDRAINETVMLMEGRRPARRDLPLGERPLGVPWKDRVESGRRSVSPWDNPPTEACSGGSPSRRQVPTGGRGSPWEVVQGLVGSSASSDGASNRRKDSTRARRPSGAAGSLTHSSRAQSTTPS